MGSERVRRRGHHAEEVSGEDIEGIVGERP
jgi:hypothetical protein